MQFGRSSGAILLTPRAHLQVLHGSIARRAGSQLVLTDEFGSAVFTAQLANGAWSVRRRRASTSRLRRALPAML